MNPQYEFITNLQERMLDQARLNFMIRCCRNQQLGLRGIFFDRLGDVMISGGSWLKKLSGSSIDESSVAIYSQN